MEKTRGRKSRQSGDNLILDMDELFESQLLNPDFYDHIDLGHNKLTYVTAETRKTADESDDRKSDDDAQSEHSRTSSSVLLGVPTAVAVIAIASLLTPPAAAAAAPTEYTGTSPKLSPTSSESTASAVANSTPSTTAPNVVEQKVPMNISVPATKEVSEQGSTTPALIVEEAAPNLPEAGVALAVPATEKVTDASPQLLGEDEDLTVTTEAQVPIAVPESTEASTDEAQAPAVITDPEVIEVAPATSAQEPNISVAVPATDTSENAEQSNDPAVIVADDAVAPAEDTTPTIEVGVTTPADETDDASEEPLDPSKPVEIAADEPKVTIDIPLAELDETTATPEQIASHALLEDVYRLVYKDGDVDAATQLILDNFHDASIPATAFKDGKEVYEPTDLQLFANITELTAKFRELIRKNGFHQDVDYINETLMALTVLQAFAKDESILNSTDVQSLIAAVAKPKDEYLGKLFDQVHLPKAKETLAANDGVLVDGVTDSYEERLQIVYAYLLMALSSDKEQADGAQAIKAEEAAEAERKRQAEERNRTYSQSIQGEALTNLMGKYDKNTVEWRTFYVYRALLAGTDLNNAQVAGIIGNLLAESWFTMDPNIVQQYDGNAHGIAQWEGGRLRNLIKFAEDMGTTWNDLDAQIAFLIHELPTRQNTLKYIKEQETQDDAAFVFMKLFETPRVVLDAYNSGNWSKVHEQANIRSARADPYIKALTAESKTIQAAREKAEAEARARAGMTFDEAVDMAKDFFDNRENYLQGMNAEGLRNQCTALVDYFRRRFMTNEGPQRGNGHAVATLLAQSYPNLYRMVDINHIEGYDTFSLNNGRGAGHTGMIVAENPDGSVIIVEANVSIGGTPNGLQAIKSFGGDRRSYEGRVNVEQWSSIEAWLGFWQSWGYSGPTFADPIDNARIEQNVTKAGF